MKTFTAKQFVKRPRDIYEAAHEDGKCEITHERFRGRFEIIYIKPIEPTEAYEIAKGITENGNEFIRYINKKPSEEG